VTQVLTLDLGTRAPSVRGIIVAEPSRGYDFAAPAVPAANAAAAAAAAARARVHRHSHFVLDVGLASEVRPR